MFARYLFILATACLVNSALAADDDTPDYGSTLTGDWGGKRTELYNKGIDWSFGHKTDIMSSRSGGIKTGTGWLGYTEAGLGLDLDKLLGWNSTTAFIHYHSQLGTQFNSIYTGTFAGVDNTETAVNTAQFYEAWIQKNFADDTFSLLGGLYPVDSEFYVTDTSGLFIQPPYGMSAEMAQGGQNGPPVYPMGAFGIRLKYTPPSGNYYVQYALTDGVPGDPNNAYGTHIQFNKGDGSLSVFEMGLTPQDNPDSVNKTAVGFWHYSASFADMDPAVTQFRSSEGFYLLAEHTLMAEKAHPEQGLAGFIRYGTASKDLYQADWSSSIGLNYLGLFDGRDEDEAGIAFTYIHAGSKYLQLNPGMLSNENMWEITYRAVITPWFALQPDLQFISNPGMDPTLKNVWIIGTRAEITF